MSTTSPTSPDTATGGGHRRSDDLPAPSRRVGLGAAVGFELTKLRAQWQTRAVLAGALVVPIVAAVALHSQGNPPKDTLFGRYATTDGFSLALLVLGYAAQWVLPLLAAVVAAGIVAGEDHHGTWKTILTRSAGRGTVFGAKAVVACAQSVVVVLVLAASTIVSSVLVGGHQPLEGLTGQLIASDPAARLVVLSWLSVLAPTLAFTGVAVFLATWSRSVAVGVAAPVVIAFVLQLVGASGGVESLRPFLPTTAFETWHGFLASPAFTGPFLTGLLASAVWLLLTLGAAWALLRRRDIIGG